LKLKTRYSTIAFNVQLRSYVDVYAFIDYWNAAAFIFITGALQAQLKVKGQKH